MTPITTVIEAFEKLGEGRVRFLGVRSEFNDFLRRAIQSRDEEWRGLVESKRKDIELDEEGEPYISEIAYNCALDDILEASKPI